MRARSILALALVLALGGCLQGGTVDAPGTHDLDEELTEAASRADPCANHPGGTLEGDDLLVRVDKDEQRQLAADWAPGDLVALDAVRVVPGRTGKLRAEARDALTGMLDSALAEAGIEIRVRSAYRSFVDQCLTWNAKVERNGLAHAIRYSARPGRSQHQLGTTVDLTVAVLGWELVAALGDSTAGIWLAENAWRFGFALSYPEGIEDTTGYAYEPWHFRYVGTAASAEMHELEMDLDPYLRACEDSNSGLRCGAPLEPSASTEPPEAP